MTYLDEILGVRRAAVEKKKSERPISGLRAPALTRRDLRDFGAALTRGADGRPRIIAEFKRASPSAGSIAPDADPAAVASAYERGGAAAISIITEPDRFRGGFSDLQAARAAVSLPVLCKDFVVDEYQLWEAAAEGADAVLLIVAALDAPELEELLELASALRLAALVEVHDEDEARRAVASGARLIGVNNRDLRTFSVDTETALRVRTSIPAGVTVVAESGYSTHGDVSECGRAGIDAMLIGERLMRDPDPSAAIRRLLSGAA
jgi:indole-3-glycerol phosphate synthase